MAAAWLDGRKVISESIVIPPLLALQPFRYPESFNIAKDEKTDPDIVAHFGHHSPCEMISDHLYYLTSIKLAFTAFQNRQEEAH